ncbi:hypothetical protein TNCV_3888981 [Trichonephila clavipes]|nr:hypothetical protein TNCV_3888981 [Trichonephila clavipes]
MSGQILKSKSENGQKACIRCQKCKVSRHTKSKLGDFEQPDESYTRAVSDEPRNFEPRSSGKKDLNTAEDLLLLKGPVHVKYVGAQTSSRWSGLKVRRGCSSTRNFPTLLTFTPHHQEEV